MDRTLKTNNRSKRKTPAEEAQQEAGLYIHGYNHYMVLVLYRKDEKENVLTFYKLL